MKMMIAARMRAIMIYPGRFKMNAISSRTPCGFDKKLGPLLPPKVKQRQITAECTFAWNGPRSSWPQRPRGPSGLSKGFPPKAAAHIVRSGTRNLDDNASGARPGAWPPDEKVFQDFPIVCGGKWLSANITMNQVIYDLCARTHAHHLVVRLTL